MCVHKMIVCEYCLEAIESHEGKQYAKRIEIDDNETVCEWCEEPFEEGDEAVEIIFE